MRLTIPVGSKGNTVTIERTHDEPAYAITKEMATWVPGFSTSSDLVNLIRAVGNELTAYQGCTTGKNWIGRLGCTAKYSALITGSVVTFGVKVVGAPLFKGVGELLSGIDNGTFLGERTIADVNFNGANKTITIAPQAANQGSGAPGQTPPQPQPQAQPQPGAPTFTVMNTSETPPDGVWFRDSPHTADTDRVTGHGVYRGEQVQLQCYAWGDPVGAYSNRLWYDVTDISRPTNHGQPNVGYLNAHYINDGLNADQVDLGVPAC